MREKYAKEEGKVINNYSSLFPPPLPLPLPTPSASNPTYPLSLIPARTSC